MIIATHSKVLHFTTQLHGCQRQVKKYAELAYIDARREAATSLIAQLQNLSNDIDTLSDMMRCLPSKQQREIESVADQEAVARVTNDFTSQYRAFKALCDRLRSDFSDEQAHFDAEAMKEDEQASGARSFVHLTAHLSQARACVWPSRSLSVLSLPPHALRAYPPTLGRQRRNSWQRKTGCWRRIAHPNWRTRR